MKRLSPAGTVTVEDNGATWFRPSRDGKARDRFLTMSAEHAMYSLISVFVTSAVLDKVLAGVGTDKACYVITQQSQNITARLLSELGRGVTILNAVGAYSKTQVKMLLCVVGRMELMRLKQIVSDEDPRAFVFITDTHETLGEGFRDLAEQKN